MSRVWVVVVERWRSSRGWLEAGERYLLPPDEAEVAVEDGKAAWPDPGDEGEDAGG